MQTNMDGSGGEASTIRIGILVWLFAAAFSAWAWIEIGRAVRIIWQHCFCAVGLV